MVVFLEDVILSAAKDYSFLIPETKWRGSNFVPNYDLILLVGYCGINSPSRRAEVLRLPSDKEFQEKYPLHLAN